MSKDKTSDNVEKLVEILDSEEMQESLLDVIKEQGLASNQLKRITDMGFQASNNIGKKK